MYWSSALWIKNNACNEQVTLKIILIIYLLFLSSKTNCIGKSNLFYINYRKALIFFDISKYVETKQITLTNVNM